ncbi:hypothetical protein PIB30_049739 [Stylosanthes scabra]|uniref:PB1-like domain-containing protein n=1 Tax=Stylosanthes scabra TaxID=79078 RepID=A0ABU6UGS6_9FABA|nr:hypothetical protein [Stylosanthes scabra]
MDLDFVNFGDMAKLFEDLRYTKYKAVYWLDKNAPELETGLNELEGDAGIRDMLDYLRTNRELEFHLYWEHVINEPVIAKEAPGGEISGANAGMNAGAMANQSTWRRQHSRRKMDTKVLKTRLISLHPLAGMTMIVTEGVGPSGVHGPGGVHGPSNEHVGAQPGFQRHSDSGSCHVKRRKGKAKVYEPQFVQSDEDYAYEYHSETLHTPVSSEEEYKKYEWPELDDEYEFGEGHFELGTKFATIEKFRDVVKDLFIAEGRNPE